MRNKLLVTMIALAGCATVMGQETLPPVTEHNVPQNLEELWVGFGPRTEPMEIENLKEWEEEGVVLRIVRYRIGIFKGQKAKMAAVYGFPRGRTNLPGLVQIHGGGQYADYRAVLTNAKRGYATIGDDKSLKHISCPIIFLSPSNDFHGLIDDLQKAVHEIAGKQWRVTCSPHHNHQDTAEYQVAALLWFDQHSKGTFSFPQTPQSSLNLKSKNAVPTFTVTPDASKPILSVDIFYTQQGRKKGEKNNHENTKNRFWHYAAPRQMGNEWTGIKELRLGDKETLRSNNKDRKQSLELGKKWQGPRPEFRNLRWITE